MQQYIYYTDGSVTYRDGVRSGVYVLDKAITSTGFNGSEGTDWVNLVLSE